MRDGIRFCITFDEFCSKDDDFCAKNDDLCIKNDGFCTKQDEFCIKKASRPGSPREVSFLLIMKDVHFLLAIE